MARWLGLVDDPQASGSGLDDLVTAGAGTPLWPAPTLFPPISSAQVDAGARTSDRNNEIVNQRAHRAPDSFAATPGLTFTSRPYPKLMRPIIRKAMGGTIASTGTAPASISSTVGPTTGQTLPSMIGYVIRENQIDRLSGLVVAQWALDLPVDGDPSFEVTMEGLYHDVDPTSGVTGLPTPSYTGYDTFFQLRDVQAFIGATPVLIDCVGGFGLTYNNQFIDDFQSRFCAGKNVEVTVLSGVTHKLWYPDVNKASSQLVTGRLDFGDVRADQELQYVLAHADKLVVEMTAGPLGTTPAANEMLRLTIYKRVLTGGGAEPMNRDQDQRSSYEFTGYLDETANKDLEATFVGTTALT